MSEQPEGMTDWLEHEGRERECTKAGIARNTLDYIAQLEADSERLDQFFTYGTALMDLKEDKPTAGRIVLIHACVPMNRAAFDAKVEVLKKSKEQP